MKKSKLAVEVQRTAQHLSNMLSHLSIEEFKKVQSSIFLLENAIYLLTNHPDFDIISKAETEGEAIYSITVYDTADCTESVEEKHE